MKKILKELSHSFIVILFFYVCFILLIPFFLAISPIREAISLYLSPLSNLKAAYIGFVGASLGSLVAVLGALWVQHNINKVKKLEEVKKSALIVYYDLTLAFDDIINIFAKVLVNEECFMNDFLLVKIFQDISKSTFLYLDSNWINNVASLSTVLSEYDIKRIYRIYGDLLLFNRVFSNQITDSEHTEIVIKKFRYKYVKITKNFNRNMFEYTLQTDLLELNLILMGLFVKRA